MSEEHVQSKPEKPEAERHEIAAELIPDQAERATIWKLIRRLSRNSAIQVTAQQLATGFESRPESVTALTMAAMERSRFRWRERIVAAWVLGLAALEPWERTIALGELERLASNQIPKDNFGAFLRLQWRALALTIPLLALQGQLLQHISEFSIGSLLGVLSRNLGISILAYPVSNIIEYGRLNRARAAAILSLGRLGSLDSVATVAAAVYDKVGEGSSIVKKAAERSLPVLLARLTPEHYGKVSGKTILLLCRILHGRKNHLTLAALHAVGKVGGGGVIPNVSRLVKKGGTHEIRNLAARVLPVLEERQRLEQAPRVLLRAATPPDAPEQALLRPVGGSGPTEPAVLLRPSSLGSEP